MSFLVPAAQRADRAHRNRVVFPLLATWTLSLTGWSFLLVVSLSMAGCDGGPQQIAGPLRSEAKTYFAGFGRGTISRDREEKTLASSASVRRENSSLRHGNSTVKLSRLKTTPPFSAAHKPFFAPDRPRIKDLGLASGGCAGI